MKNAHLILLIDSCNHGALAAISRQIPFPLLKRFATYTILWQVVRRKTPYELFSQR
jgi:hypothetical protein